MNRFVLAVEYVDDQDTSNKDTVFVPVNTWLCRAGLEASLLEAAEAARLGGRWPGVFGVPGTNLEFGFWSLVTDGRFTPPRVFTVDEWFTEYGRG